MRGWRFGGWRPRLEARDPGPEWLTADSVADSDTGAGAVADTDSGSAADVSSGSRLKRRLGPRAWGLEPRFRTPRSPNRRHSFVLALAS